MRATQIEFDQLLYQASQLSRPDQLRLIEYLQRQSRREPLASKESMVVSPRVLFEEMFNITK